jgi:hypothetical protein
MQNNQGFHDFDGLFTNAVSLVFTPIALMCIYIGLFVLTVIGVYFSKKNDRIKIVPPRYRSNVIYLNSASEQWHKNRRII